MSTQPRAVLARSSPRPARGNARGLLGRAVDAQRLAMLKVSDYDAWLGECEAKWRVLRKKLAVVATLSSTRRAASARDDGGDRSGALAGAPAEASAGALAGLRATQAGASRGGSRSNQGTCASGTGRSFSALVALAKLASGRRTAPAPGRRDVSSSRTPKRSTRDPRAAARRARRRIVGARDARSALRGGGRRHGGRRGR